MTYSRVELTQQIIALAERDLNKDAAARDRDQEFSVDLWRKCGELRLQGMVVPEGYGGLGLSPTETVHAIETLGWACRDSGLAFAICAHMLACVVPILKHGTEGQKRTYLPGLSNGTLIAANAMSEPASGSDVFSMATTARAEGEAFRIDGRKTFVSNAPVCDVILTYAATDDVTSFHGGVTCFLIPAGSAGITRSPRVDKMSLRTCQMGDVVFESALVQPDGVIGKEGSGGAIFAESMEWERTCMAALHVGAMQRILDDTVAHARIRTSTGQPIGKYQAVSHRLADMKVRLEAARELTERAASSLGNSRDSGMWASIAKLFVSESLLTSATDSIRILGGYGVLQTGDSDKALRDAMAATIYSGTSEIQKNIIARWIGL